MGNAAKTSGRPSGGGASVAAPARDEAVKPELAGPSVQIAHEAACQLWPLAVAAASKGKLVPPAEAERLLASTDVHAVDNACASLQRWCWMRGLPPLDRVIAHPRMRHVREIADYDVFFEAMAVIVTTEAFVFAYPWRRVQEPSAEEYAWASHCIEGAGPTVRRFRACDLELELREADAARGRTRPVPAGFAAWSDVAAQRERLAGELAAAGVARGLLRPPGSAPYPPPRPRASSYEH